MNTLRRYLHALEFALLPGRCLLCDAFSALPQDLCDGCRHALPWLGARCSRCATPQSGPGTCSSCTVKPPPFSSSDAAFAYSWPVDRLILQFKDTGQLAAGRVLTELMIEAVQRPPRADYLVPVPLLPAARRRRGFNQATEIARRLSRSWNLPVDTRAERVGGHGEAKRLKRQQRFNALRGAFSVPFRCDGANVVVVDDVMTTGATAGALAAALLRAGAASVGVVCIARVP